MKKFLLAIVVAIFTTVTAFAQVTTSSMTGTIKDSKGVSLPGATVKAVHTPSGTTYATATNANGLFTIPGMRIGGPYTVTISFIGYKPTSFDQITLQLGQGYVLNTELSENGLTLQEVSVSSPRKIAAVKLGASTNINRAQITALPTINRSIVDFTRLTPQSTGTSFAGRDNRLNNTTVDGANLNNTFGTSSDPLPGGGAQPISIEAYDEISVNIAPFDVRQTGFTGAGIYATTRSGTNTFHGSAYTYYKDQSFNGNYIGDNFIGNNVAKSKTNTYGFTVGGPIIKNKLFFFANYEQEKATNPGIAYSPTGGSGTGQVTPATVDELNKVKTYLAGKGYDTGDFDNFPAFQPQNKKFLFKLDWNINDNNKFTIKYSYLNATSDNQVNAQSIANGGSFVSSNVATSVNAASRTNLPNARYGTQSIAFQNSNYGFKNVVSTGTAELNTRINSKMSNQVLLAFKNYDNPRTFKGTIFPTIDILNGANSNYITAGMDPFTNNNEVIDNSTSLTDNFTYYAGKHTLTAGLNYEYQKVGNAFMPGSNGHYIYNSLDDFLQDKAPIYFSYTYSLIPGQDKVFSANLKIGQFSGYIQDEYNVTPNFKLTYGIRVDKPTYLEDAVENPQVTALSLPDQNGVYKSYNNGVFPKARFIFSPRVGFRASLLDDNSLVVRGGLGVFTGRIPYVSLTNAPSNSGMYQFGGIATSAQLAGIKFNPNAAVTAASLFPTTAGTTVQPATALLDPNYKFPQIFRTDLAIEKNLGDGWLASVEALYTKDINATKVRNANLKTPTGTINEGDLTRVRYVGTGTNGAVQAIDRAIYPNLTSVVILENTNEGYSAALTAQLSKQFKNGLSASVAYTYTASKEISSNVGSTAPSVWAGNYNVGTSNDQELRNSNYYVPHRIVANASYKFSYLGHAATTVGVFFQGQAGGANPLSYIYGNDINGDGNASDLMYIPKRASELNLVQYSQTVNGITYTYTVQQQQAALEQFINNSPYLSKHRGEFADRNAAFLPWYTRIDANILQDFYIMSGKTKHTLQLSAVVQNLPNLLSKYYGVQKIVTTTSPLTTAIDATTGLPTYSVRQLNGKLVTTPFQDATTNTTWSILIGAKYIF